jgi:hypothetical protein
MDQLITNKPTKKTLTTKKKKKHTHKPPKNTKHQPASLRRVCGFLPAVLTSLPQVRELDRRGHRHRGGGGERRDGGGDGLGLSGKKRGAAKSAGSRRSEGPQQPGHGLGFFLLFFFFAFPFRTTFFFFLLIVDIVLVPSCVKNINFLQRPLSHSKVLVLLFMYFLFLLLLIIIILSLGAVRVWAV